MSTVALQPMSSRRAQENSGKTLRKPIKLDYVRPYVSGEEFARLESIYPDKTLNVWGVRPERLHQKWKMPPNNCLVLFRTGSRVFLRGIVTLTTVNERLALYLWGPDEDGEAWSFIYFLKSVKPMELPATAVNEAAQRERSANWQGFTVLMPPVAHDVIALVKSVLPIAP